MNTLLVKSKHTLLTYTLSVLMGLFVSGIVCASNTPLFINDILTTPAGELVMLQKGDSTLVVYDAQLKHKLRTISIGDTPTGMIILGNYIYVTTFSSQGQLHKYDLTTGQRVASVDVYSGACAPMQGATDNLIYVCNQFQNSVTEVDVEQMKVVRSARVLREPRSAVLTPDGRYLFVANFLPSGRANLDYVTSFVSVIDTQNFEKVKDIPFANGSNALRGICVTPDGKYVYVSHNLGRFTVPTSQLQQGWMNTSAFSIIDVASQTYLGPVLVDEPERGAAGIWNIACSQEHIYISHSGTHEISVIDHQPLLSKLATYKNKAKMEYDLNFLYGLRKRIALKGNGPRAFVVTDSEIIVPTYFADIVNRIDRTTLDVTATNLNPNRQATPAQEGEMHFNDAMRCFQQWQSCNGCHPGDGRQDGLNWDLMNDGVGNSKNCKSLLYSLPTPPAMISGIRESSHYAIRTGFRFIQFYEPEEDMALAVEAYLESLEAVPSPYLVNGQLSELARKGEKVFEKLDCGRCHSGIYYTDRKMHRIGQDVEFERGWDTPTLREVWRTAPYLFDGRAETMREVFTTHKHGIEKKVSVKDINALVEYVNSL